MKKENYDQQFHLYFSKSTKDALDRLSTDLDMSQAHIIRHSVNATIQKMNKLKTETGSINLFAV